MGQAVNFDDAESDEVRRYFIENALEWITDFHIDSLRLDAVHAIVDTSARPSSKSSPPPFTAEPNRSVGKSI